MQIDTTREPQQDRSREKKLRLQKAAEELFAEKGFDGTNSKEIAKKAGVSIGSFYSYYKDKESIFIDIVEYYYQEIFSKIKEQLTITIPAGADNILPIVENSIDLIYQAHQIKPELHREISIILLKSVNSNTEFYRVINQSVKVLDEEVHRWLLTLLMLWLPQKDHTELETITSLIFRASEETIHRMIQFPDSIEDRKKLLKQLSKMIYSYIKLLSKEES